MKAMILLGAPGAGKGTVAELLKQSGGLTHVSTGDMLRAAVKAATPVGREAQGYMERGELVPDDVIVRIVKERLAQGAGDEFYMFDGFPRTVAQAEALSRVLDELNAPLQGVYLLEVPREVLIERLAGRRVCRQCGAVYHVRNIPTKVDGVCDQCGGPVIQRTDDNEDTVRNRLEVFARQTADLIAWYEGRGKLVHVPAAASKESTERAILDHLAGPAE